jgi:hypothetical protein
VATCVCKYQTIFKLTVLFWVPTWVLIIFFSFSDMSEGGPSCKKQSSIQAAMKPKFDQKKASKLYYKIFIQDILPNHLTDSAALREFVDYLNPNFLVPSRRTLTRDISKLGGETKVRLDSLLDTISYICCYHSRQLVCPQQEFSRHDCALD